MTWLWKTRDPVMITVFFEFSNSERLKLVQSVQQALAPVTNTSSKKGLLLYFHLRKHRELLSSVGSSSSITLNGGGPLGSVLKLFSSLPTPSGIIQFLDFIYQLYGRDPQICMPALTFPLTPDPLIQLPTWRLYFLFYFTDTVFSPF